MISVIIPIDTTDSEKQIKKSVCSVDAQSIDCDIELLACVVSEADGIETAFLRHGEYNLAVGCKNIPDAINRGIKESKYDNIAILMPGSLFFPEKLEIQMTYLANNVSWGFAGFGYTKDNQVLYSAGSPYFQKFGIGSNRSVSEIIVDSFPIQEFLDISTFVCSKKLFGEVGMFNIKLQSLYFYDMCLRLAYVGEPYITSHALSYTALNILKESDIVSEIELMKQLRDQYVIGDIVEIN